MTIGTMLLIALSVFLTISFVVLYLAASEIEKIKILLEKIEERKSK